MKNILTGILVYAAYLLSIAHVLAQSVTINGPAGSGAFGKGVYMLANGNFVITDPSFDDGPIVNVGAVYLYQGRTHALISTLKGSQANDMVGKSIAPLTNGNFVVASPDWHNGVGAATWVNGITGLQAKVGTSNSLTGSVANDKVASAVTVLTNGNYVVLSPYWNSGTQLRAGAFTWGDGMNGTTGPVGPLNSMVGSSTDDQVGSSAVPLNNGHYVVFSRYFSSDGKANAGAVTWGHGDHMTSGVVSGSNSLVGNSADDQVGLGGIKQLTNGNYVVLTPTWANGSAQDAGAVTWCDGNTGGSGVLSSSNSLVGTSESDHVGSSILILSNGNYVALSPRWCYGSIKDVGAATWCNGAAGRTGTVEPGNSLIGSQEGDKVGSDGSIALSNGNYVVASEYWSNGAITAAGAVTLCNGNFGRTGIVGPPNSLVGSSVNDRVGTTCRALPNGHYVVSSPYWNNGAARAAGAATWCSGFYNRTGTISASNSFVGSQTNDRVGYRCVPLKNGTYVVLSPYWANGANPEAGAATWGNGSSSAAGVVDAKNSLIGTKIGDLVGYNCLVLENGNYVVLSPFWNHGTGAATWSHGISSTVGLVSSINSVTGAAAGSSLGFSAAALANGSYVIASGLSSGGSSASGATTWMNGAALSSSSVSLSNSLVTADPGFSWIEIKSLPNDNYLAYTTLSSSMASFAVGNGKTGTTGLSNDCNSVTGHFVQNPSYAVNTSFNYVVCGFELDNKAVILSVSPESIALSSGSSQRAITDTSTRTFLDASNKLICTMRPTPPLAAAGSIAARLFIESGVPSYNGASYVRRHFDLSPTSLPISGKATTTLYFTQAEFDEYNSRNGSAADLPKNPQDEKNVRYLKITLQRGRSVMGAPGSYGGWTGAGPATISIDPEDSNIVWNACDSRWEVTFDMEGYGGLFISASTENNPLSAHSFKTEQSALTIAPVPAVDRIYIRCETKKLIDQPATITDVYGRTIHEFRIEKDQQLDIHQLESGTYFLRAGDDAVYKFIKL